MARQDSAKILAELNRELVELQNTAGMSEKALERYSIQLEKAMKIEIEMAKATKENTRGTKELMEIDQKSTRILEQKVKVDKQIVTQRKQLTQVSKKQRSELQALRTENQRRNKIAREEAKLNNKNISAYERLNLKIRQSTQRYRDLVIAEGKETKEAKRLRLQIQKLNRTRDLANKKLRTSTTLTGVLKKSTRGLLGVMAKLGLAMGAFMILRDMFGVVKSFDQANANLASVLGVTREETAKLTEQQQLLGSTTKFTAAQVADLQTEYAKLGFTQEQILGVTEATLQLAAASGTDLANAATIVGSTLRAFDMDVSETQRLVDVMAKSFSASSLDIEKFKVAMSAVAPAAKTAGFSVERTTALIGTLTNAGIDASTAGTGLRNIFLELSKRGITFEEAMSKIANASDQNSAALDLFGKTWRDFRCDFS